MAFARLAFKVLLILLVLLIGIGLVLPSHTTVERSIVIHAPPAQVFPHVNGMRAFHAWSPWTDIDPETTYTFEGPDTGVGSRMAWQSGNQQVGAGSQEITVSQADRQVTTALEFGGKGSGTASFFLEPAAQGTLLRWEFQTEFGWDLFSRYVGLMLDSMIGASYDKGLRTLKLRIEQPAT
ncbi:MAG: SRPBCC family protein [Gammaproteobacteria bacterium]|nr:SRPBCC family protein [Gammaproteobacteria bacterium]